MAKSSGNSAATQIQRIASQTQLQLQQMVNSSNELQSKYNAEEAQKSRDWQTQMSKTAHQMEVEDLKKAGLNPVLSSGGSGAQSYTTSSASITPESGASAAAGVQEAQIGSIGSMESSRIQAAATKKAAAVSAAAMRSAAATSAAAQMYAASLNYKKGIYSADKSAEAAKYTANANIKIAQIGRGKSWAGLLDKYLSGSGIGAGFKGILKTTVGKGIGYANKLITNPKKFYNESWLLQHAKNGVAQPSYSGLNQAGKNAIGKGLTQMGLKNTAANRKAYFNAFVLKNQSAANSLFTTVYTNSKQHASKTNLNTIAGQHKTRRSMR